MDDSDEAGNGSGVLNDRIDELDNRELTKLYLEYRQAYRNLIRRAERVSRGSAGIPSTGNRMFWASVLFTRIVVTAKSVEILLPDPKAGSHWDFSDNASLARNLLEACLVYYWLCGPNVSDIERDARFILYNLHDHGSRRRLFPDSEENPEVYDDLVRQFNANQFLLNVEEKRRRELVRGEKTPFVQDEVLVNMGIELENFRLIYRFFSQHTHTGPISFYRVIDHDRGAGVETRREKQYMLLVLEIVTEFLVRAIDAHLDVFPDAETRRPYLTRSQIEAKVEIAQGRRAGRHRRVRHR